MLGRRHDASTALAALDVANRLFERVSCDMIYARPGQTAAAWREELSALLDRAGRHLSLYQLTIEPGTPFAALHAAGRLATPDGDVSAELYEATADVTAARGLAPYEISNYAVPGSECRHNLVYWRGGDWLGVGPGAHGRLTVAGERFATSTERHPERWLAAVETRGHGLVDDEVLGDGEIADELLVMGLRLDEGLDVDRLERLSGRRLDRGAIADLEASGFLEWTGGGRLRVRPSGRLVLDAILRTLSG